MRRELTNRFQVLRTDGGDDAGRDEVADRGAGGAVAHVQQRDDPHRAQPRIGHEILADHPRDDHRYERALPAQTRPAAEERPQEPRVALLEQDHPEFR